MRTRLYGDRPRPGRLLSLLLVFLLLFAAAHVSQHDLVEGGGGPAGHSECQLSHAPGALLCASSSATLLFILVFVVTLTGAASYTQTSLRLSPIRAPPSLS
ncbi:MAG: hypothetical protein AB1469_00120 [Pseudomonadota bacterium]